jgi:hypothetical protein
MAAVVRCFYLTAEAEYFCAKGWTGFTDLPVVLICRTRYTKIKLAPNTKHRASG